MQHDKSRAGWVWSASVFAIGVGALFLLAAIPTASAAAPVQQKFTNGCDPNVSGDPYIAGQYGKYGGGPWIENFTAGVFVLPTDMYAQSILGGSSFYALDPWIHFGPGTPNATSCIVEKNVVASTLTFVFIQLDWTPQLIVNCGAEGSSASASYYFNVTGDLYDYTTASWVVSSVHHVSAAVGSETVSCTKPGSAGYSPGPRTAGQVVASTGLHQYILNPHQQYFYFADVWVSVYAVTHGSASATATVSHVGVALQGASCPGC